MKQSIIIETFRALAFTGLLSTVACGLPSQLQNALSDAEEGSASTESGTGSTSESTTKSASDQSGDWISADSGESVSGLAVGDLQGVEIALQESQIEVRFTVGDTIPSQLEDDLSLYALNFVVYDPDLADAESGYQANVAEQVQIVAQGSAGTALATNHTVSSALSGSAPSVSTKKGVAKYDGVDCPYSDAANAESYADDSELYQSAEETATEPSDETTTSDPTSAETPIIRSVLNGSIATLTIPLDQLHFGLDELCNLELGAIVETDSTALGHVVDVSDAITVNDGICAGYTRARCWLDNKCTELMTSSLMTKAECKEMDGKGWGPDKDDCHAL
ncbi:MAG: hypothetical protein HY696_07125 [Deltaproteobacteria bacterium]|nr:hypothetical protein [Deltaproteobacteria bacterium]